MHPAELTRTVTWLPELGKVPPLGVQDHHPLVAEAVRHEDATVRQERDVLRLIEVCSVVPRHVPLAERHEDFVMLVEAETPLGWNAASRLDQGDIMLSLKNPADFPVTFLWFSNQGRDYAPWNGRHKGVLGIEEGRAYSIYGHAASVRANPLSDAGIATSLDLDPTGSVTVSHVLGGLPLPAGWQEVSSIEALEGRLRLSNPDGVIVELPFDDKFLQANG